MLCVQVAFIERRSYGWKRSSNACSFSDNRLATHLFWFRSWRFKLPSLVPKVYFESGDMLADDFGFGAHERVVKEIVCEFSDDPKKPRTLHG